MGKDLSCWQPHFDADGPCTVLADAYIVLASGAQVFTCLFHLNSILDLADAGFEPEPVALELLEGTKRISPHGRVTRL